MDFRDLEIVSQLLLALAAVGGVIAVGGVFVVIYNKWKNK